MCCRGGGGGRVTTFRATTVLFIAQLQHHRSLAVLVLRKKAQYSPSKMSACEVHYNTTKHMDLIHSPRLWLDNYHKSFGVNYLNSYLLTSEEMCYSFIVTLWVCMQWVLPGPLPPGREGTISDDLMLELHTESTIFPPPLRSPSPAVLLRLRSCNNFQEDRSPLLLLHSSLPSRSVTQPRFTCLMRLTRLWTHSIGTLLLVS